MQSINNHTLPTDRQRYEDGTRTIPDDIEMELYALSQQAEELFEKLHEQAFQASNQDAALQIK